MKKTIIGIIIAAVVAFIGYCTYQSLTELKRALKEKEEREKLN